MSVALRRDWVTHEWSGEVRREVTTPFRSLSILSLYIGPTSENDQSKRSLKFINRKKIKGKKKN